MEIPTLSEYDSRRAKIRCSLQWVVVQAYTDVDGLKELALSDIENPFESDGGLKKNITTLLCSGDAYCRIVQDIYGLSSPIHTPEEVIHTLCRHEMYILGEKDSVISARDIHKKPLDLNSHLLLIDMLMFAFVHGKRASVEGVVSTIRKFSSFSASRDFPDNMEEALVLWINKINSKVQAMKQAELESDKSFGQTREDGSEFNVVENISEDLCDGRSLAVLLHYYCPASISLQDICLKNPTSLADSWHNVQLCLNLCNEILLPPLPANLRSIISSSVLRTEDFLYSGTLLKANMISFLGNLYYYLETEGLQDVVRPLGHAVTCRRQKRIITAEFPSMVSKRTQDFVPAICNQSSDIMSEATTQILPEVQPLISNATRRSFVKNNNLDTNGVPIDENPNSPIPFSSKPLLVRRNKEPTSAFKPHTYQRSTTDYVHNQPLHEQEYFLDDSMHMQPDKAAMNPIRKSNSYQGLDQKSAFTTQLNQKPVPVSNKWHMRSAVHKEEIRCIPAHNSARPSQFTSPPTGRKNPISFHPHPQAVATSTGSSSLLSNVVMDFDDSKKEYLREGLANQPTSVNLPWNGFQHVAQSADVSPRSFIANDLRLETARTIDDQLSLSSHPVDSTVECSSQFYDSGHSVTDSASASASTSRNTQSVLSSNETVTMPEDQDNCSNSRYPKPTFHNIPDIVSDQYSPGKPNSTTGSGYSEDNCLHGISDTNSEASTIPHPPSQQSYTIQNGTFHTVDSARAAGYPVIVNTDNTYILPIQSSKNPVENHATELRMSRKSRMSSFADTNGSVLSESPVVNSSENSGYECGEMTVGDSVVKLRNPRHSKSVRSAKTTSWIEIAQQQNTEQSEINQRGQRNLMSSEKLAQLRHQLEERRRVIEREKKMKEREWAKELLKIRKEMYAFAVQSQQLKAGFRNHGTKSHHRDESKRLQNVPGCMTSFKNEETSSDYSSKSPSPSSVSASERAAGEHHLVRDLNQQTAFDETYTNFFASPLSSTTYLIDEKSVQGPSYIAKNSQQQTRNYCIATAEKAPSNQNTNNSIHIENIGKPTPSQPSGREFVKQDSHRESIERTLTHRHPTSKYENKQDPPASTTFTYKGNTQKDARKGVPTTESASAPPPAVCIREAPPPVETCTRRSLFPGGQRRDDSDVADQENIDPNNITIATDQPSLGTYDSFCKLPAGSNHSTPAKLSPCQEGDQTTFINTGGENQRLGAGDAMTTVIIKLGDSEKKKGEGFELLDETTPNTALAKKKEQFLLKQLKKEEELKRKKADRENVADKRRQEERHRQEEAAAKKEEERLKRQQRLEDYKKRKMMEVEAQHMQEVGIIHGGNIKKHLSSSRTDLTQIHRTVRSRDPSPAKSSSPAAKKGSVVDSPRRSSDAVADPADALHVGLSRMPKSASCTHRNWETDSASASSAVSSDYTGPKLYKQPSVKSNRNLIYNAICHCCLPAKVNETSRNKTIEALETSDARHLMILFRDLKCQYRALYVYDPDAERLQKLTGNGPATITPNMIEKLFKYNSGRKAFLPLPSKTLSVSIDAITVKNSVWLSSKKLSHQNPLKK